MEMQRLILKYRPVILYAVFGALTTAVNALVYLLCFRSLGCSNLFSTAAAWFVSVLFACITNKLWVFESRSFAGKTLVREIVSFFSCRIATGVLDMAVMYAAVDCLAQNALIWKMLSNVIVIILNYIAGRRFVFKSSKNRNRPE